MNILAKRLFHDGISSQNQVLEIENSAIVSIKPFTNETINEAVDNLAAGLIETHINGGYKHYFTQTPTYEGVKDIYDACVAHGTAFVLPCLITSPLENILKGIDAIKKFQEKHPEAGVIGMHLEGPFLNVKKRGAHLEKYVRMPTDGELDTICKAGEGVIKLMTIAPENFTETQIKRLRSAGFTLSIGHTNATYEEAQWAFSQGIHLVTHLYNAMSGLQHRQPGVVGAALANTQVYAPIILDGHHCHYGSAKVAYQAKKDKLFLISDALFLGKQTTHFQWQEFDATLQDGTYINSEGNLAGAAVSLADTIRNAVNEVEIPLEEAIEMATLRPAQAIGLAHRIGNIALGMPSIFTKFDDALQTFEVLKY